MTGTASEERGEARSHQALGLESWDRGDARFATGWRAALAEAWAAYCSGSYAIGAVIVDQAGEVIARGRNRLGDERSTAGNRIAGHDLAHAEINALLNLVATPRPEVYSWTLLTTVEPCPQCAGAIAMSGIRAVEYAAPDPWAGCTRLLTEDPYVASKGITVGRAPAQVQAAALRLALVGFLEDGHSAQGRFLKSFGPYRADLTAAAQLYEAGTLRALREQAASLDAALPVLLEGWTPEPLPLHLSSSPQRVGRVCAWIEHQDQILMTELPWGGWTLPGGGVDAGEDPAAAAVREAWEECGAVVEVTGDPVALRDGSLCFPARLRADQPALHPSPEGRARQWVNPRALPWADDLQLRDVLAAWGQTPPALALPPRVALAQAEAARVGFGDSCSLEVGRLLRALAASCPGGRLAGLGTGVGVGAAWLLAGMTAGAYLLTVETDPERAAITREVLKGDARVTTLHGDWRDALEHGPFDLIFADCGPAKRDPAALAFLIRALKPGGLLVMDNFSPPARLPERFRDGDPDRERLWSWPGLHWTEVPVSSHERVVLGVRH